MAIKIKGEVVITDGEDLTIVGNATIGGHVAITGSLTVSSISTTNGIGNTGLISNTGAISNTGDIENTGDIKIMGENKLYIDPDNHTSPVIYINAYGRTIDADFIGSNTQVLAGTLLKSFGDASIQQTLTAGRVNLNGSFMPWWAPASAGTQSPEIDWEGGSSCVSDNDIGQIVRCQEVANGNYDQYPSWVDWKGLCYCAWHNNNSGGSYHWEAIHGWLP